LCADEVKQKLISTSASQAAVYDELNICNTYRWSRVLGGGRIPSSSWHIKKISPRGGNTGRVVCPWTQL